MIALVGTGEAARLDSATARDAALSPLLLMEGASLRIWTRLEALLREDGRLAGRKGPIVALAGGGNNGGDALAVLRHARFAGFRDLGAILLAEKGGELYETQLASLRALDIPLVPWHGQGEKARALLKSALVLIDGIAGTGLGGPLRPEAANLVREIQPGTVPILALDLPSGLGDAYVPENPVLSATWTASIEPRKACLYFPSARELAGSILPIRGVFPVDAVLDPQAQLLEEADLPGLLPRFPASAHKGRRGRLGLLAGAPGMVGAAAYAASGAAAAGAGLVTLFADSGIYPGLAGASPVGGLSPTVVRPLPGSALGLDGQDALVVGPGWGQSPEKARILAEILNSALPVVLDADALRLLPRAGDGTKPGPGPRILCPHPGEFEALSGVSPSRALANPLSCLPEVAAAWGGIVILKSHVTWIASPDGRIAIWEGLEPGLGTAGSGDVLAGLAGGFLAALCAGLSGPGGLAEAFQAACAAAVVHGLSGRAARLKRGWFTASDLAQEASLLSSGSQDNSFRIGMP